jgi:Ca2+-binding RTX toxin-like protein
MRSTGDQQALNDDGTPRRKYDIAEPHDSKIFLRATIGLVLANAAILIKNILYPSEAKAAFSLPSFAPIQPLEGRHAQTDERFLSAATTFGDMVDDSAWQAWQDAPAAIGFGGMRLYLAAAGSSVATARFADNLNHVTSGLPLAGNDNVKLYGAAPGSAISLFAKEAADTAGVHAAAGAGARGTAKAGSGAGSDSASDPGAPDGVRVDTQNGDRDRANNRAPQFGMPVMLGALLTNQLLVIALSDLLGSSYDPDGDTLGVGNLHASSGTLTANIDGSWNYVASSDDTSTVTFNYLVSDGLVAVAQTAKLDINAPTATRIEGTSSGEELVGTSGDDSILAQAGADTVLAQTGNDNIFGGDGNDRLEGGDGDDVIYAGAGDDVVYGGSGNDIVYGGGGADAVYGEAGDDTLLGEAGSDVMSGGSGNDAVDGGDGDDTIAGDDGDDLIYGSDGSDTITGGTGSDRAHGGGGDDRFMAVKGDGNDAYTGGQGPDTYDASQTTASLTIDLGLKAAKSADTGEDTIDEIENVVGSTGNDWIVGNDAVNLLDGGNGDDLINGGAGADSLLGGAGNDWFVAKKGDGNDTITGGDGLDTYDAKSTTAALVISLGEQRAQSADVGDDHLEGIESAIAGSANDTITGDDAANLLDGGGGDDLIAGGGGGDTILANTGNDTASGGGGADTFLASNGDGNDQYDGGEGRDTYDSSNTTPDIVVSLLDGTASSSNTGTDQLTGIEDISSGSGNDHLIGNAADNEINCGGGNDLVEAGAGNNVIAGGVGDDVLRASAQVGNDVFDGGGGNDTYDASATSANATIDLSKGTALGAALGIDLLTDVENVNGGSGDDAITGNSAANIINAGAGNDTVNGDSGNDTFVAGTADGNDVYTGGSGLDTYDASSTLADALIDLSAGDVTSLDLGTDTLIDVENAIGGSGNDVFIAGNDVNMFVGGEGNDTFVFGSTAALGQGEGNRDKIMDFQVGDRIDLDQISQEFADVIDVAFQDPSIRHFVLIGAQDQFTKPGEISFKYQEFEGQQVTILQGNIDNDADAEFELELVGHYELRDEDFVHH